MNELEITERELSALINGDDFNDLDWEAMERYVYDTEEE